MLKRNFWTGLAVFVLTVAMTATALMAGTPSGAGPTDPLMVTGTWQTLAAGASAWYYFDYGADRSQAEVDVDANGVGNIQLTIYTPAQATAWLQDPTTKPVGLGSPPGPQTAAAIHDLVWLGAFNTSGRYFAVVTNKNPASISYRVLISGASVTLAPTPTATPYPTPLLYTPVPTGTIQGRLVFQDASGGNIYTVNGDGSNLTRVTTGIDPAWSPDGKRIAFTRWSNPSGVYVANADGTNEQLLDGAAQTLSPQWSPDQTRLVFTQQLGSTNDSQFCFGRVCFTFPGDQFWRLKLVNLNDRSVFDPSSTKHSFAPTFGVDNQTIAYADAQFGILTTLANGGAPSLIYNQNSDVQSPRYSPDGSKIVFEIKQHDHWEISVMNADGSNAVALTQPNPLAFVPANNVAPTWSPDGKQILFLSDRSGKWEFYVVNLDGTGLARVLQNVTRLVPINYNFTNERVIDWIK